MKKHGKTMAEITIIVVNYNSFKSLINCLKSIKKNLRRKASIIVIDNSSDDSTKLLPKRFSGLKIIKNKINKGFAKAVNQGIEVAQKNKAEYVLLVNPDVMFRNNIDHLFETLESFKEVGIISPLLKVGIGNIEYYDLGAKLNKLIGRTKHIHQLEKPTANLEPDLISGCVMGIRTSVIKKIGSFNEKYFLYFEDSDFCLRAKKTGFKLMIDSGVTAFHFINRSLAKKIKIANLIKSNFLFINDYVNLLFKPIAYLYILFLIFKSKLSED